MEQAYSIELHDCGSVQLENRVPRIHLSYHQFHLEPYLQQSEKALETEDLPVRALWLPELHNHLAQ